MVDRCSAAGPDEARRRSHRLALIAPALTAFADLRQRQRSAEPEHFVPVGLVTLVALMILDLLDAGLLPIIRVPPSPEHSAAGRCARGTLPAHRMHLAYSGRAAEPFFAVSGV